MTKQRFFLRNVAMIASLAVTSMMFSGCDKDSDPNDDPNNNNEPKIALIAGKFASRTGSGNAVFYADFVSTELKSDKSVSLRSSQAVSEKELVGKIEDGDIIFNLKGVYDEVSKQFFLSAGSSMLVYSLAGTLTDGNITAEASVKVKNGDQWTTTTVPVAGVNTEVEIGGTVSNTQEAGIPTSWYGTWVNEEEGESFLMTDYQMIWSAYPDLPSGYLDITPLGNGKYEMVWESWEIEESDGDGGGQITISKLYYKIVGELTNAGLVFIVYGGGQETFAAAKAEPISGDDTYTMIVTRP